jgi:hypothetical protein
LKENSTLLRFATLQELGGAENIVRMHLDQVMERFSVEDRQMASRVFRYLITPSALRSRIPPSTLPVTRMTTAPQSSGC